MIKKAGLKTYLAGLLISLTLTMTSYLLVLRHVNSRHQIYGDTLLITIIIGLALVQFMAQLFFFLHLGTESKPKWNTLVFVFMAGTVLILVIGSLWIMHNLNYHSPEPSPNYIIKDEGFGHSH